MKISWPSVSKKTEVKCSNLNISFHVRLPTATVVIAISIKVLHHSDWQQDSRNTFTRTHHSDWQQDSRNTFTRTHTFKPFQSSIL